MEGHLDNQYFEPPEDGTLHLDPLDLVGRCYANGTDRLLLEEQALPPEFFDLSSGVAGDLMQKLVNYGIRLAVVVPDPTRYSESFQSLAREANRSRSSRFFADRDQAIEWLTAEE